jgi:beta-lactamase regulating signal transducer with metallopeptidase domain
MNIDQTLVAILGTYALHSSLAVFGAWLVTGPTRLLREPRAVRGTWKLALFLPLISSAFQLLGGYVPPGFYAIEMGSAPPATAGAIASVAAPAASSWVAPAWTVVLSVLWAAGATLGLWKLVKGELALRRMLRGREEVLDDHAVDALIALRKAAGVERRVRLSASASLSTPIAVGRSEIVLSRHALEALPAAQMKGVIGHELAHLQAGDPWWARAIALVEAFTFFQPLNYWAKRMHRDAAELAADDWARRVGIQGESLARALAEIAAMSPDRAQPSWAQAAKGGSLVKRVERLLAEPTASLAHLDAADAARAQGMPKIAAALGALAGLILLAPRIGFASEAPSETEILGLRGSEPSPAAHFHPEPHRRDTNVFMYQAPGEEVFIVEDRGVIALHVSDGEDSVHLSVGGEWGRAAVDLRNELTNELERELGRDFGARIEREVLAELADEGIFIGVSPQSRHEVDRYVRKFERQRRRAEAEHARAERHATAKLRSAQRRAEAKAREAEAAARRAQRALEGAERAKVRAEQAREELREQRGVGPAGRDQPVVAL